MGYKVVEYLTDSRYICRHNIGEGVMGCKRIREITGPCFEWCGVKED